MRLLIWCSMIRPLRMRFAKCPVCTAPAKIRGDASIRRSYIECYRCGEFGGDDDVFGEIQSFRWSEQQIANASGYIRRNQGLLLSRAEMERLAVLPTSSPSEKAARLLMYLGELSVQPGTKLEVSAEPVAGALRKLVPYASEQDYPDRVLEPIEVKSLEWLSIAAASNGNEFAWLLKDALIGSRYLEEQEKSFSYQHRVCHYLTITPQGWGEIARMKQVNVASGVGFVAMSFREEFNPLYDHGIAQGIAAAGYESRRVDRTEHNNRIDDEIIASIKQSRFLVADFTVNRGGIYFEAGLALGLGLPVIWLVREDKIGEVHFDNRQYNFIKWKDGEWDDFAKRLRFRIESTIGRGPITKS